MKVFVALKIQTIKKSSLIFIMVAYYLKLVKRIQSLCKREKNNHIEGIYR